MGRRSTGIRQVSNKKIRKSRKERRSESGKHVLSRILEDYIFQLARSTGPAPLPRMAGWGGRPGHFYIVSLESAIDQKHNQRIDHTSCRFHRTTVGR